LQARRVARTGQIAFYHRLYYVGIAHKGTTVYVALTPEGLSVYTTDQAWTPPAPGKDEKGDRIMSL